MRAIAFALLVLLFGTGASAREPLTPCRPGARVVYVNGVNKPNEQDVARSAGLLAASIRDFGVECVAEVDYYYNPSDGLALDLLSEVAAQKATELGITFLDAVLDVGLVFAGQTPLLFNQPVQDEIRARLASFIQGVSFSTYSFSLGGTRYTTADFVERFRDLILEDLSKGTKVVLVAHSQGNFFANEAHAAVVARAAASVSQGLAVVNVANATLGAPSGLSVTSFQDQVIGPLAALNLARPANFAVGFSAADLLGHGFDEIYLSRDLPVGPEADSIGARVIFLVERALSETPDPIGVILGSTSFSLFDVNLATATSTASGSFRYTDSAVAPVWDIAVHPRTGAIYAISANTVSSLDRTSLALTRLPQSTLGGNALAFNADGELYGMGGSAIFRVDPATGLATPLPLTLGSFVSSGDITFDAEGTMFVTGTAPDGSDHLLRIDLNRMRLADVGSTGYRAIYGLYFSAGILYGVTNGGLLLQIDSGTGRAVQVGTLARSDVTGLQ